MGGVEQPFPAAVQPQGPVGLADSLPGEAPGQVGVADAAGPGSVTPGYPR